MIICVVNSCGTLSNRMMCALIIQLLVMVFTVVLAVLDTRNYPETFFWLTIVSNAVMNVGGGIYQSSAFGSAGNMPFTYINALSLGINLSGVIVSVFDIISTAIAPDPTSKAVIYFSTAIVVLIACIVLEYKLRSNVNFFHLFSNNFKDFISQEFRVYYINITENEQNTDQNTEQNSAKSKDSKRNPYLYVLGKIYPLLIDIFLIFFVSFAIFPSVMASIVSSDNWISDKYFGSVFCFLVFQTFTFIGTITAEKIRCPTPDTMIAFTSIRLLFIPFYLLFDYRPANVDRKLPVLFRSDLMYFIFNIVLAWTNGHLPALALMYAPNQVEPGSARIAGMMSALMILVGILSGFYFSLIFPHII